jgi:hypothetical protein
MTLTSERGQTSGRSSDDRPAPAPAVSVAPRQGRHRTHQVRCAWPWLADYELGTNVIMIKAGAYPSEAFQNILLAEYHGTFHDTP